jgi:hypothetical protein
MWFFFADNNFGYAALLSSGFFLNCINRNPTHPAKSTSELANEIFSPMK